MNDNTIVAKPTMLPKLLDATLPHLNGIMEAFNLPREIIASDDDIAYAWRELPREIMRIPEELRDEIDRLNEWLFPNINNGTYRMMFARSVEAYDEAAADFFSGLDYLEERLEGYVRNL